MKILFLGNDCELFHWLKKRENIIQTSEKIISVKGFDFIISYNYRYILKKKLLTIPVINLHISLLPWNRGADPNFWSFIDNTPKGVTIHFIDEGIDTGDIIVQKKLFFNNNETLRTSYNKLQEEICQLFKKNWHDIKIGKIDRIKQNDNGSFHLSKDKFKYYTNFEDLLDLKIFELKKLLS